MHDYSAKRSSNDDAAKTSATLGPPARRAAAIRASISPRTLTAGGGALNLAGVAASAPRPRRGVSTGLSRAGSILRGGFWPRATSCRRRVAPSRGRTPRPAATTATTGSRQPGGELAIPRGPHGSRQEKGVGGHSSRRLVQDDGLDAIHLLDLREHA